MHLEPRSLLRNWIAIALLIAISVWLGVIVADMMPVDGIGGNEAGIAGTASVAESDRA
jgi:hypothetical protein